MSRLVPTLKGNDYTPASWGREEITYAPHCVVYTEPRYEGHVTVDYKARVFRLGISTTGPANSTKQYVGRGWKRALELDATACLHAAVNT